MVLHVVVCAEGVAVYFGVAARAEEELGEGGEGLSAARAAGEMGGHDEEMMGGEGGL